MKNFPCGQTDIINTTTTTYTICALRLHLCTANLAQYGHPQLVLLLGRHTP